MQPLVEVELHALVAVLAGFRGLQALVRAFQARFRVDVEDEREIGREIARDHFIELLDHGARKSHADALHGAGGVDETVTDHPLPLLQRGADRVDDMLVARGGEQQRLGQRLELP